MAKTKALAWRRLRTFRPVEGCAGNEWIHEGRSYFYIANRRRDQGALTGRIFRLDDDGHRYRSVGTFRIEADGTVSQGPFGFAGRLGKETA